MKFEINNLGKREIGNFNELIWVFKDVFEMENFEKPDDEYLNQLLRKKSFFVFVAIIKKK